MNTCFDLKRCILPLLLILALLLPSAAYAAPEIPDFAGEAAIELNNNVPALSPDDYSRESFIRCSELDALGRVGPASACLGRASVPTELRAQGGAELPVGWVTARYDDVIDGHYLYSLCFLIAPSLGGSDTDSRNVFTGTRTLREGMRLYEELIADYLARTVYHVLYRVTPVYRGSDLVPIGVQMEARSVEDSGHSVSFNVFLYNIQDGIAIDYATGQSRLDPSVKIGKTAQETLEEHWFKLTEPEAPSVPSFAALFAEREQANTAYSTNALQQTSSGSISIPSIVYIPNNGKADQRYHKFETHSGDNPTPISIESAAAEFDPCGTCWTEAERAYLIQHYGR